MTELESLREDGYVNRYAAFNAAIVACSQPVVHPDYAVELAAYNQGLRPWPPCERCAGQIVNGPYTGATECEDCHG